MAVSYMVPPPIHSVGSVGCCVFNSSYRLMKGLILLSSMSPITLILLHNACKCSETNCCSFI